MNNKSQHSYIFFLGSHPVLSRLEVLRALTIRDLSPTVREETEEYIVVATAAALDPAVLDILGGSDRFSLELARLPEVPTGAELGPLLPSPGEGKKINIGLSTIGIPPRQLREVGESLKEWWQAEGGKMRYIVPTGKAPRLNAAQVMAHKLDQSPNAELTLVRLPDEMVGIYRTVAVQDISAYELRDTQRPYRDPTVGLLPPKLAQIMLNLAIPRAGILDILDPFCGMGTVLQEGWLMDHRMIGSDSSERMVKATQENLEWLREHFLLNDPPPRLFVHQANTRWARRWEGVFDVIVTEPFLGKPLKRPLPQSQLEKHMNHLGELYRRVFTTLKPTLKKQGRMVFILPAFRKEAGGEEWQLFPEAFLDALARVGYSKDQLGIADRGDLLYARPDALVGRELTVWQKA